MAFDRFDNLLLDRIRDLESQIQTLKSVGDFWQEQAILQRQRAEIAEWDAYKKANYNVIETVPIFEDYGQELEYNVGRGSFTCSDDAGVTLSKESER